MDADTEKNGDSGAYQHQLPEITADDMHEPYESDNEGPEEGPDEETDSLIDWTVEIGGEKFAASIDLSSGLTIQRADAPPEQQLHWQKVEREPFRSQLAESWMVPEMRASLRV